MLNRFVETAATGGNSNGASAQNQSGCLLKSIQHFFLKWIVIEDALLDWKERLMAVSEADTMSFLYIFFLVDRENVLLPCNHLLPTPQSACSLCGRLPIVVDPEGERSYT